MSSTEVDYTIKIETIRRIAEEDATNQPPATDYTAAPWSSEAITPQWMTGALCGAVPGAEVIDLQFGEIDHGSNSRQAIGVTYNEAGNGAELPVKLFAKSTPDWKQRIAVGLTGSAFQEWSFYRDLRSHLGTIESPNGFYGVVDGESCRSIVLLEDVSDRVQQWGNPVHLHVDRGRAESMVDVLAQIHGRMWANPRLDELAWLRTGLAFQQHLNATLRFEVPTLVGFDRAQERALIPDGLAARRDDIVPALMRSFEMNNADVHTLLHFDVHINNWYLATSGSMGIMDWGCVSRGNWASDFAYMLMGALTIEDRRAWECDLLARYLEKNHEHGGNPPLFDEAWLRYRQQTHHGWTFWLSTIGFGEDQPEMQADEICVTLVERMSQAIVDLGAFAALDEG
jgi:Phosphotransferase enzyme family